jgi:uncharacterized protein DUF6448
MPPHCDSLDGPVVKAAIRALEANDVDLVLPFVYEPGESEVRKAFEQVIQVRRSGGALAREVADRYFFETVVRVHRAGEGAPYTGLKPAGLSEGPVIPVAERAIETGVVDEVLETLCGAVRSEVKRRFDRVMQLQGDRGASVDRAREYVEAMLGFEVYSHKLYQFITADPHHSHRESDE